MPAQDDNRSEGSDATVAASGHAAETENFDPDALVGQLFARKYKIQSCLGVGGMGAVYKAYDEALSRTVAVKVLLSGPGWDTIRLARFKIEAKAAGQLNDSHIVQVYEFDVLPDGKPYLVMSYVDGVTLSDLMQEEKSIPIERAIEIFCQALEGLSHAHQNRIVHRDIKPSNLMISKDSQGNDLVKIVDFGIAKLLSDDENVQPNLTQTGEVFGSPNYMSPEQCKGWALDERSDIYAFGVLMYEVVSGKVPFSSTNFLQCVYMHINDDPAPFASFCAERNIPRDIEAIIFKALEKEPEDRYQSANNLLMDLRRRSAPAALSKKKHMMIEDSPSELSEPSKPSTIAAQLGSAHSAVVRHTRPKNPSLALAEILRDNLPLIVRYRIPVLLVALFSMSFLGMGITQFTDWGCSTFANGVVFAASNRISSKPMIEWLAEHYREFEKMEAAGILYAYLGDDSVAHKNQKSAERYYGATLDEISAIKTAFGADDERLNGVIRSISHAVVSSPGDDEPQIKAFLRIAREKRQMGQANIASLAGQLALGITLERSERKTRTHSSEESELVRQCLDEVEKAVKPDPDAATRWHLSSFYKRGEALLKQKSK